MLGSSVADRFAYALTVGFSAASKGLPRPAVPLSADARPSSVVDQLVVRQLPGPVLPFESTAHESPMEVEK